MEYHTIDTLLKRDPETFKVNNLEPFVNNVSNPMFSIPKVWQWTEKIDGANIRIFKSNSGSVGIAGRTKLSLIPKKVASYIYDHIGINAEKIEEIFGQKEVVIYGEGYGGKIQAGAQAKKRGGKYSETEKFIVFDILVNGKYWLKRQDIEDVCGKLGLDVVPYLGLFTIEEACRMARYGFKSELAPFKAEGLIGRTEIPLFDSEGRRLICKIKTKDF